MPAVSQKIIMTRFPFMSQLGGGEFQALKIAKIWRDAGHQVIFLGSCAVLQKLFKEHGFTVVAVEQPTIPPVTKKDALLFPFRNLFLGTHKRALCKQLQELQPDKVFMLDYLDKLLLWPFLFRQNISYVFFEQTGLGNWFYLNPMVAWYWIGAFFGQIVTVSQPMQRALRYFPNVSVITNGITLADWQTKQDRSILPDSVLNIIGDYGKNAQKPLLTYCAQMNPGKGHQTMLTFCNQLKEANHDFRVLFLGNGSLLAELQQKTVELGLREHIVFHPFISDQRTVAAILQHSFCSFLLSEHSDSFGLTVAESIAAGTPALVSSQCGISDMLPNAFVVSVKDPQKIVHTYRNLVDDYQSISALLPALANTFTYTKMAQAYLKLLK